MVYNYLVELSVQTKISLIILYHMKNQKTSLSNNPYRIDATTCRLLILDDEGLSNKEIAEVLNLEGHRTLRGCKFTVSVVAKILATVRALRPSRYTIAANRMEMA